jgi:predicted nucleic acid-binding protein
MHNIISNTNFLIIFDNLKILYVLKELYGNIIVTEEVSEEFGKEISDWIKVVKV